MRSRVQDREVLVVGHDGFLEGCQDVLEVVLRLGADVLRLSSIKQKKNEFDWGNVGTCQTFISSYPKMTLTKLHHNGYHGLSSS